MHMSKPHYGIEMPAKREGACIHVCPSCMHVCPINAWKMPAKREGEGEGEGVRVRVRVKEGEGEGEGG